MTAIHIDEFNLSQHPAQGSSRDAERTLPPARAIRLDDGAPCLAAMLGRQCSDLIKQFNQFDADRNCAAADRVSDQLTQTKGALAVTRAASLSGILAQIYLLDAETSLHVDDVLDEAEARQVVEKSIMMLRNIAASLRSGLATEPFPDLRKYCTGDDQSGQEDGALDTVDNRSQLMARSHRDPAFAAIEAHRQSLATFQASLKVLGKAQEALYAAAAGTPEREAAAAAVEVAEEAERETMDAELGMQFKLTTIKPTTIAGALALMRYATEIPDSGEEWSDQVQYERADGTIKKALWENSFIKMMTGAFQDLLSAPGGSIMTAQMEAGARRRPALAVAVAPVDPIFALIERHHLLSAEAASLAEQESAVPSSSPEFAEIDRKWRVAMRRADAIAWALVDMVPSTREATAALLAYIIQHEADGHCWPNEEPDAGEPGSVTIFMARFHKTLLAALEAQLPAGGRH